MTTQTATVLPIEHQELLGTLVQHRGFLHHTVRDLTERWGQFQMLPARRPATSPWLAPSG